LVEAPGGRGLYGHHRYPGGVRAMLLERVDPFDEEYVLIVCAGHHANAHGVRQRR
jgi:hypothetical protein